MKERIKQIRKNAKETQQAFADKLHVSKSTIEGYEYGRLNITDRIINDICREYDIEESWLRTGKGKMYRDISEKEEILKKVNAYLDLPNDSTKKKIAASLDLLSEDELDIVLGVINTMLEKKSGQH